MAKKKIEEKVILENEKPTTKAPAERLPKTGANVPMPKVKKPAVKEEYDPDEDYEPDYEVDEPRSGSCECGCDDDCLCCSAREKVYTLLEILKSGTLDEDHRQVVEKKLMNLIADY
jgi:hypothetical protein